MKPWTSLMIATGVMLATPAADALEPYSAEYKVRASIASGISVQRLRREPDGSYMFTVETRPTGLAGLFVSGKSEEISLFEMDGGTIRPIEYRSVDELDEDDGKYGKVVFDWANDTVSSTWKGERKDFVLERGMLDTGSLQLALMRKAAAGEAEGSFDVVHKNELRQYRFVHTESEEVRTGAGHFDTVIYQRQRPGSDRVDRLWLAPELDYLPVKMVQYRRGKKHISLILKSFDRTSTES